MLKVKDENTHLKYSETFNIIEYAEGGAYHNGTFKSVNDKVSTDGKNDCYHTVFLHTDKIKEYYKTHINKNGKNSVEGYSGEVWATELIIDFDIEKENKQEDLVKLLEDLKNLLKSIESRYDLDLKHIRINFSGKKGFHIRIPSVLFGGFTPSDILPSQLKAIAAEITAGMKLDNSIYSHIFYIRYVNSRNSKSGLCAIPLTAQEIFTLSIAEIKELAQHPSEIIQIDDDELEPNRGLVELKETATTTIKKETKIELDDSIWFNVPVGQRNKTLAQIVGMLIERKLKPKNILSIALLWNLNCEEPEAEDAVKSHVERLISEYGSNLDTFWKLGEDSRIGFNLVDYRRYLEEEGFAKTYVSKDYIFIQIKDNRIKEVSQNQIKDHVLKYVRTIDNPHKEQVEEALLNKHNSAMLGENMIECIRTIDPKLNSDTKDKATFFFNNNIIEVTKEGIRKSDYSSVNGLVWESQIIKRDIQLLNESKSDFEKLLLNVSGQNAEKFKSFQSAIGYLLHSHKDSSNAKVVVLCDQKVTEFPDGRTGKSLFGKAISKVKKSVRIDGKNFEFNSRFTFQQVDLDTQVLEFNDVKKDFDFENLFSVVTDDMTIENKGQRPFVIPFETSPKILASTNYTIRGLGSSFRDRLFEIEFSDFYNEEHRPIQDFGRRFFDDWDELEWNKFYNFMFECVKIYLTDGLIYPVNENLQERKIIDSSSREFKEFIEEQDLKDGVKKKTLYEKFQKNYPDYMWLKQNTFSKWIKAYCNLKELKLYEVRSNGQTLIYIK